MADGYIKLWRGLKENPVFQDSKLLHVWVYCLLEASHKSHKTLFGRREVSLHPGEFITGRHRAAMITGISEQSIRSSLMALEAMGMITRRTTNKGTIISICNWSIYQGSEVDAQPAEQPANQPMPNQQPTTIQEGKEGKEKKPPTSTPKKKSLPPPKVSQVVGADIVLKWNTFAQAEGLPQAKRLNTKRRQSLSARSKDGMLAALDEIFNEIRNSDFLHGVGGRDSWKGIDFDWLFGSPHNWVKVLEGKYRNKSAGNQNKPFYQISEKKKQEAIELLQGIPAGPHKFSVANDITASLKGI